MNYPRLMPTEKRIADVILQNSDDIDTLSINAIAQEAQASKAAVTRFCKHLGYNGFKDFRVSAINDTHAGFGQSGGFLDAMEDTHENRISRICQSNARACLDTALLLDRDSLSKAAEIILGQKRIIFVGEGAVSAVLMDLYQKLLRVGIMGVYSLDQRMQRMQVSLTGPQDVVIAVDLSGSKRTTMEMVEQASQNGARIITMCNAIGADIAKWGDANLVGPGRMGSHVSATLEPRMALLCIVDCLFDLLENKMGDSALDGISKTGDVIVGDWAE